MLSQRPVIALGLALLATFYIASSLPLKVKSGGGPGRNIWSADPACDLRNATHALALVTDLAP
jgi:hypothetical protein